MKRQEAAARKRLTEMERDRRLLADFDLARMKASAGDINGTFDFKGAAKAYASAFRNYEIDLERLSPLEAVREIVACPIRHELIIGALEWCLFIKNRDDPQRMKLLKIAAAAASDEPAWEKPLVKRPGREGPRPSAEGCRRAGKGDGFTGPAGHRGKSA